MKARLHCGFTFIELMVTMAISLLLFSGIAAGYNQFTDKSRLVQAALTFKNDLRLAQNKAISGEKPVGMPAGNTCDQLVGYTVTFDAGFYSIQALCSPFQPNAPVSTITLPKNITFFQPPLSITFQVLTRGVNISTSITFTLVYKNLKYYIILSANGDIIDSGFTEPGPYSS